MKNVRRVATALTGLAGSALVAVGGTIPAEAGGNGQQVAVITSIGVNAYYLQVCGHNQNSTWVCTPVEHNSAGADTDFSFPGWWFKGNVNVWGWNSYAPGKPATYGFRSDCYVNPTNSQTNYSLCYLNG